MTLQRIDGLRCFEGTFTFDTTNTGATDYVFLPPDAETASIQLTVLSTASAAVEATISTIAEVEAGQAIWQVWSSGYVTGGNTVQDATKGPVTAIRLDIDTAKAGVNAYLSVRTQGDR